MALVACCMPPPPPPPPPPLLLLLLLLRNCATWLLASCSLLQPAACLLLLLLLLRNCVAWRPASLCTPPTQCKPAASALAAGGRLGRGRLARGAVSSAAGSSRGIILPSAVVLGRPAATHPTPLHPASPGTQPPSAATTDCRIAGSFPFDNRPGADDTAAEMQIL